MNRWRILVVDDVEVVAEQTAEVLRSAPVSSAGEMADIELTTSFERALAMLAEREFDLLVLDVRNESAVEAIGAIDESGDEATDADVGLDVYADVRARRFVPIIFYTAVPGLVTDLANPPFVAIVSKRDELEELRNRVREVFDSTLPAIHQALLAHVEQITKEFMAEFVEKRWPELRSPPRKGDLAHLLLRRLALSLLDGGETLAGRLADEPGLELRPDVVHPMRYYVVPPVGSWTTGDLLRGPILETSVADPAAGDEVPEPEPEPAAAATPAAGGWYVMLTPSCDLVPERVSAEFVVLAQGVPLAETPEFKTWRETAPAAGADPTEGSKRAVKRLEQLMRNRRHGRANDRDVYLPGAWNVPDLVVDLQRIVHLPHADLERYTRVATLDSPYSEALVEKFGRYLGRVGTPDLDISIPLARLADA